MIDLSFKNRNGAGLAGGAIFLDDLPRLPSGKIAMSKLKKMGLEYSKLRKLSNKWFSKALYESSEDSKIFFQS